MALALEGERKKFKRKEKKKYWYLDNMSFFTYYASTVILLTVKNSLFKILLPCFEIGGIVFASKFDHFSSISANFSNILNLLKMKTCFLKSLNC